MDESPGPPPEIFRRSGDTALRVLTCGDGDLSFSLALATWWAHQRRPPEMSPSSSSSSKEKGREKGTETLSLVSSYPPPPPLLLTATTLDSFEELHALYGRSVETTISRLRRDCGAVVLHGIDATRLDDDALRTTLLNASASENDAVGFDIIIWNFPFAGFVEERETDDHAMRARGLRGTGYEWTGFASSRVHREHIRDYHQNTSDGDTDDSGRESEEDSNARDLQAWVAANASLVSQFFGGARALLASNTGDDDDSWPAQIVLSHKTVAPYDQWRVRESAREHGLRLSQSVAFDIDCFPGYMNRRGAGKLGGRKFPMQDAVMDAFTRRDAAETLPPQPPPREGERTRNCSVT